MATPSKKAGSGRSKTRIFLVDDHPIVRRGFQLLLSLEPDLTVCGEAEGGPVALEKMTACQPDVAIVDLSLKGSSGLELVKQLRRHCPHMKILVFSMHDELYYAERVLRSGAHGYLTKEEGTEKAIEAVRQILQGKRYVSQPVTERMLNRMMDPGAASDGRLIDQLTDRELEVLDMIGRGLGSREIAQRLRLSIKTVESHREHIKAKLGLGAATELANYAFTWVNRETRS